MKLGFGLHRYQLTKENFRFARQCGATHLVAHLNDYSDNLGRDGSIDTEAAKRARGWGPDGMPTDPIWTVEGLQDLKKQVESEGLKIWAIENFEASMWNDILLDGPRKEQQMEWLQQIIRNVGQVGIPVFGYNFSIAGVCCRDEKPVARGGAVGVVMQGDHEPPMRKGETWCYSEEASEEECEFFPHDELWKRLEWFLKRLVPVAEEAQVRLAAHPDDPPMPVVRNTPRLVYQPSMYQRLLDLAPSRSNALEYCLGTLAEMTEGDIYEHTDHYSRNGNIAYVHFRNIKGTVPRYHEVFIDEGDLDMIRILRILKKNDYQGVLIPDHSPLMTTCRAPWHASMAYAMGFMKAALTIIGDVD